MMMLVALLLLIFPHLNAGVNSSEPLDPQRKHHYPSFVPKYDVRIDVHTNETVSRGRLHLINYSQKNGRFPSGTVSQMVSFTDFQRHLQCASPEAELDGTRGGWSLLRMAPPTKQSAENICAWTESKCSPWVECERMTGLYKAGYYQVAKASDLLDGIWGGFRGPVLLRVIENELYYDWPWGTERFAQDEAQYAERLTNHYALLEIVLRIVKDIGDSVFFFGGERGFLQWNVPFPTFSFAPSIAKADFPFPWFESYEQELLLYGKAEEGNDFSQAFYSQDSSEWEKRVPKAAFFSSFTPYRQVVYDSAALRPDLIDASFQPSHIHAWNPRSDEPPYNPQEKHSEFDGLVPQSQKANYPPGFIKPILQFGDGRKYDPHQYKYVIVPTGTADKSTSGRLAGLLAHSGAVVLLQQSTFAYHFSARLQPWVHYVPLSHSMADVIDKIEWLKRNDHLARQIALNAQNFALSYLRLEDYLCYAAGSLHLLHDLEKNTDVLQAFNATRIPTTYLDKEI